MRIGGTVSWSFYRYRASVFGVDLAGASGCVSVVMVCVFGRGVGGRGWGGSMGVRVWVRLWQLRTNTHGLMCCVIVIVV